jgi:surfactin synthase thioesterase subunit
MHVLYFHGFASSPASAKIEALRPLLEAHGISMDTPDLNVPSFARLDFDGMVEYGLASAMKNPPRVLAGSSLGALVALSVAKRGVHVPLVLIAPALGVATRWKSRIPDGDPVMVFNHALNADAPIHRAFFEQITNVHVDDEPPPARVTALMGRNDETVPFWVVEETWQRWEASGRLAPGSKLVVIGDGDHGLVAHADAIREAIVAATENEQ